MTGDFTIEFWIYRKSGNPYSQVLNSANNVQTFKYSTRWYYYDGSAYFFTSDLSQTPENAWTHIAFVRNGSTVTMYANGINVGSITYSSTISYNSSFNVCNNGTLGETVIGNIADLRIVKGTAIYTSTFTPPTTPLTAISGTSLLANMTNAGIPDSAMMNNLETVGNAQVSTSVKKFGTGSIYLDGTGDYLKSYNASTFGFGTGDFTIEFWNNLIATTTDYQTIIDARYGSGTGFALGWGDAGYLSRLVVYGYQAASLTQSDAVSTWVYIAIVRNNSQLRLYVNGTLQQLDGADYQTLTTNFNSSGGYSIGKSYDPYTSYLNGYIDDLRITKGYARYTANFTPPTAPFYTY